MVPLGLTFNGTDVFTGDKCVGSKRLDVGDWQSLAKQFGILKWYELGYDLD